MRLFNSKEDPLLNLSINIDLLDAQGEAQKPPEIQLWSALLLDALEEIGIRTDSMHQRKISFRMWKQTRDWILTIDNKGEDIGSFDWVASACSYRPWSLRNFILKYHCPCCNHRIIDKPCLKQIRVLPKNAYKQLKSAELWADQIRKSSLS